MNRNDILDWLRVPDATELFAAARQVRDDVFGREVFQRGVVEFSNYCQKNCLYCGLRAANTALDRFRLAREDVLAAAAVAVNAGMGTVVLQSGEDGVCDVQWLGELIREIKQQHAVSVTLSLGDYDEEIYGYWRECGADRYLLKVETTDTRLHARMRPGQTAPERWARVETLCRLGYETGSGIITGLPSMTSAMLADDLLRLSTLKLDMIAVGPFIPHPDTPLGNDVPGRMEEALRVTAIVRLMNPGANIPATSALDVLVQDGREQGLEAGANVIMPSVTPEQVRKGYSIYPGKNAARAPVIDVVKRLQKRLIMAGYTPSAHRGESRVPAAGARAY